MVTDRRPTTFGTAINQQLYIVSLQWHYDVFIRCSGKNQITGSIRPVKHCEKRVKTSIKIIYKRTETNSYF